MLAVLLANCAGRGKLIGGEGLAIVSCEMLLRRLAMMRRIVCIAGLVALALGRSSRDKSVHSRTSRRATSPCNSYPSRPV